MKFSKVYIAIHYPAQHHGDRVDYIAGRVIDALYADNIADARAMFRQRASEGQFDFFGGGAIKVVAGGTDFYNFPRKVTW